MKKRGRATRTKDPDGGNVIRAEGRFTNMVVRRFDGGGCWQQHLQICQAIRKSNGWTDRTAVLQMFAHLEGEALNVALLMPGGRAGELGLPFTGPFRLLQLPGETGSVPAAFRERYSPTGNGPGNACHRTGDPSSLGIWRYGQTCPGWDDQGQIYRGSAELRLA